MPLIVKILGNASGIPSELDGMWLKSYDPYYADGRGLVEGTPQRKHAMEFADLAEFHTLYVTAVGTRPDGKPNRPLTAFHLQTERR